MKIYVWLQINRNTLLKEIDEAYHRIRSLSINDDVIYKIKIHIKIISLDSSLAYKIEDHTIRSY